MKLKTNRSDFWKKENPFEKTLQHLKTLDVYEIISDCNTIISNKIGKKGIKRLEEKGVKLFFRNGKIREVLKNLLINYEKESK